MVAVCGACGQRGMRWETLKAFSTASTPVCRRQIVHKSTDLPLVSEWQLVRAWGYFQARWIAWSATPISQKQPERLLGPISPHFARMGMNERTVERFVGIDVSKSTLDICIDLPSEELHVDYDDKGKHPASTTLAPQQQLAY